MMPDKRKLSEKIKEHLSEVQPKKIPDDNILYRHAGVLIPLFMEDGIWKVLFTKRTDNVTHHKGQISFPGGSVDEKDNSIEGAVLREADEEIGLKKKDVEILGRIDDVTALVSNFILHPYVGFIPCPYNFIINRGEVERLIKVPLKVFNNAGNPESKKRYIKYDRQVYYGFVYEYESDLIWGATARIMANFMKVVGNNLLL